MSEPAVETIARLVPAVLKALYGIEFAARHLAPQSLPRSDFLSINRVAFRGGSFFPMFPDGAHVACVRPFWIVHDVNGLDHGILYHDPIADSITSWTSPTVRP